MMKFYAPLSLLDSASTPNKVHAISLRTKSVDRYFIMKRKGVTEPLSASLRGTLVDLEKTINRIRGARGERMSTERTDTPRPSYMPTAYHRGDASMSYIRVPD